MDHSSALVSAPRPGDTLSVILAHLCQARDEYYRVEGHRTFQVRDYVTRRGNRYSKTYIYADGSKLKLFLVGNQIEYSGTNGKPYAIRLMRAYDGSAQVVLPLVFA